MVRDFETDLALCETVHSKTQFIDEALIGWPYAIKRAMAAEEEVDRLRNEIDILQEQLEQRRRV